MHAGIARLRDRFDAVLLDLDGTLLDARAALTPRTARAVGTLVDAGLTVLVCTGRSVMGAMKFHRSLALRTPCVAYNGQWIGHDERTPIRCITIPDHVIDHLEHTERRAHFLYRHHGERKYTVASLHAHHGRVSSWYENVVHVADVPSLPRTALMRVSLYFDLENGPDAAWEAMPDAARELLHRETFPLSIFPDFGDSDLVLCEVQARGRGKAEALEWLSAEMGIPPERTIAVGDQMNDVPMMTHAGLAVAMANSVAPVLALADVVIGHHAEEGFARWVEAGAPLGPAASRSRAALRTP